MVWKRGAEHALELVREAADHIIDEDDRLEFYEKLFYALYEIGGCTNFEECIDADPLVEQALDVIGFFDSDVIDDFITETGEDW